MAKPMTMTIETITDERIEILGDRAGEAGDLLQAAICERALDRMDLPLSSRWTGALSPREQARVTAMSVEDARAECVRVIADAEAMAD